MGAVYVSFLEHTVAVAHYFHLLKSIPEIISETLDISL
jgi:hypothetical protein